MGKDYRKKDNTDTWKEKVIEGELMDEEVFNKKDSPTTKEIRFAKLINDGVDPLKAVRKVSTVGSNKLEGIRKAEEKKANEMLKICQNKMLLDISAMAPKGLKKLEKLLNAKKEIIDKFGDVRKLDDPKTQLGAAKILVGLGMPEESASTQPSLIGAVIQVINE
jgi:hypothetical protein